LLPLNVNVISADGAGGAVNLPSVQTINAGWNDNSGAVRYQKIIASGAAAIDLSGVTTIIAPWRGEDRLDIIVETGGTIDLSSLQTATSGGAGEAFFSVSAGGTMLFGDMLRTGAVNLSIAGSTSTVVVGGGLHLDPNSDLSITGGATMKITRDFSYEYDSEAKFDTDAGIIQFHTAGDHQLEVGGIDLGVDGSTSGNLGLGRLVVGDDNVEAKVTLVDWFDNLGSDGIEALYLYGSGGMDGLEIRGNSLLIIGDTPVYALIDGEMVDLHSLIGPDDIIVPFQDASGLNSGWITIADSLPGDADDDWDVDSDDFAIFKAAFGGYDVRSDFNEDGRVDLVDFATLRHYFGYIAEGAPGAGLAPEAIPEPATLTLLALGGLAIFRRKPRA
jgi:hypothetical protein